MHSALYKYYSIMRKTVLILSVLLFSFGLLSGQSVRKDTYLYLVKDADSLYLDRYRAVDSPADSPCVIFMFGGGFFTGSRDGKGYIPYFEFLAGNGYTVVSIDYRLGFKSLARGGEQAQERSGGKIKQARAFMALFMDVVEMAVEDLFDATTYILDHAAEWGVDPGRIVANGSSAGAISVLQGEYAICNGQPVAGRLPAGFNYVGIASFAGAILADSRDIGFAAEPCPVMLFHGDADSNVPYNRIRKLGMGFFGSKHIAKKLTKAGSPHVFYSVENADHMVAASPMTDNRQDILSFLDKLVDRQERLIVNTGVDQLDAAKKKRRFGIADYIKSNFGGGN